MYKNNPEISNKQNTGWVTQKALNKVISQDKNAWSTQKAKTKNRIKKLQCNSWQDRYTHRYI